jgi:hypothetical protein
MTWNNSVITLVLELSTLCLHYRQVTEDIRSRGKFISSEVRSLQEETDKVRNRLRELLGQSDTLFLDLDALAKEKEAVLVSLIKKDI